MNGGELAKPVKDTRHSRLLIRALGLTLSEPGAKAWSFESNLALP